MPRVFLLLAMLFACSRSPADRGAPAPAPAASARPLDAASVIEMKPRGVWFGKPPSKEVFFDVTLRNPYVEPRWIVLPSYVNERPFWQGECELLPRYLAREHPRVLVVLGVCSEFWAVRLPAHATVTVRDLAIDLNEEQVPATLDLEVLVAREITIGGEPLAARIAGADATSDNGGDAAMRHDLDLAAWHPEGGQAAASADVVARVRVTVTTSSERHAPM